ncbi:tetratricopeptide repeat protein [Streptomyces vinaceus]
MEEALSARLERARTGDDPSETLWAARLLVFLGFDSEARELLPAVGAAPGSPVEGWAHQLSDFLHRRYPGAALLAPRMTSHGDDFLLGHTMALSEVWRDLYQRQETGSAARRLRQIAASFEDSPGPDDIARDTVFFRAARYEAVVHGRAGDRGLLEDLGECVTATAAAYTDCPDDPSLFLPVESARRVLDVAAITAMERGWHGLAARFAQDAVRIDPYCARAQLMLAEARRAAGDQAGALEAYRACARYGPLERRYALERAAACEGHTPVSRAGVETGLMRLTPAVRVSGVHDRPQLPVYPAAVAEAVRESDVHASRLGARFAPFVRLTPAAADAPLLVHAPLYCLEQLEGGSEGVWFETPSLQRAMVAPFRRELAHAYARVDSSVPVDDFARWVGHSGATAQVRYVGKLYAHSADLPVLIRSRLSRLLCSLGFFDEARHVLPPLPEGSRPWGLEESHAACTGFFIDSITELGSQADHGAKLRHLDSSFCDDDRALRMRLSVHFAGMVTASRVKDHAQVAFWRERGADALARYSSLSQVSAFESVLMTSRFFRAAGFLPYLTNDAALLKSDMHTWLSLARELKGLTPKQDVLARENLYPALESAARTLVFLEDPQGAERLMEEIVGQVDPLDSKAWLQVGDCRLAREDFRGALEAYLTAAGTEVPLGRVAWFKAGVCAEQLGYWRDAAECHTRSLELWPSGISPATRLDEIARAHGLAYEAEWVAHNAPAAPPAG